MFSNLYIGMLITSFIMVGMGQYQYSHGRDGSYRDYNHNGGESFNLSRYLQSENIDYKEPHTKDLLYDYDYLATPEDNSQEETGKFGPHFTKQFFESTNLQKGFYKETFPEEMDLNEKFAAPEKYQGERNAIKYNSNVQGPLDIHDHSYEENTNKQNYYSTDYFQESPEQYLEDGFKSGYTNDFVEKQNIASFVEGIHNFDNHGQFLTKPQHDHTYEQNNKIQYGQGDSDQNLNSPKQTDTFHAVQNGMFNGLPINQEKIFDQPNAGKTHVNSHPYTIHIGGNDSNRPSYTNQQHMNKIERHRPNKFNQHYTKRHHPPLPIYHLSHNEGHQILQHTGPDKRQQHTYGQNQPNQPNLRRPSFALRQKRLNQINLYTSGGHASGLGNVVLGPQRPGKLLSRRPPMLINSGGFLGLGNIRLRL